MKEDLPTSFPLIRSHSSGFCAMSGPSCMHRPQPKKMRPGALERKFFSDSFSVVSDCSPNKTGEKGQVGGKGKSPLLVRGGARPSRITSWKEHQKSLPGGGRLIPGQRGDQIFQKYSQESFQDTLSYSSTGERTYPGCLLSPVRCAARSRSVPRVPASCGIL